MRKLFFEIFSVSSSLLCVTGIIFAGCWGMCDALFALEAAPF